MMKILEIDDEIEKMESEYAGLEYEENFSQDIDDDTEIPFNADKIRIDQQMLSLKYIMELKDGNLLELNPGYQRNRVWRDNKRKSLLIESLMLRIPIPAFYFYENENSKFQVIDGQQRLATIHEFVNNEFQLTGLEYLSDTCSKKYFKDLDVKYQQRIYRTQLAVNVLDARSPKKVIYDIFRRINTGGMKLNPQEMRNAICKPQVRLFLKKSIQNINYLKATRKLVKDDRMDAQELALRFYAFYLTYDFEKEKLTYDYKNVSSMLDDKIELLNEMNKEKLEQLYDKFDTAMKRCYQVFGKYCFTKISITKENEIELMSRDYINKSLFTAYSVLLSHPKYNDVMLQVYQDKVVKVFANELKNQDYINSITVGTGDRSRVEQNFCFSADVLRKGCVDDTEN